MIIIPPCVICGQPLEYAFSSGEQRINQPYGATAFTSHGHYGSLSFDPVADSAYLEVNFCDPCLAKAAAEDRVIKTRPVPRPQPKLESRLWKPQDEDEES